MLLRRDNHIATPAQTRQYLRMQQIVRMRIAGIKDSRIGEILGLVPSTIFQIVKSPEYQELENDILTGHLSKMDEALSGRVEDMHRSFSAAVPAAMRALVDAVTQRRDLRASLEAAKEILDRDPQHAFPKSRGESVSISLGGIPDDVMKAVVGEGDRVSEELKRKPN